MEAKRQKRHNQSCLDAAKGTEDEGNERAEGSLALGKS